MGIPIRITALTVFLVGVQAFAAWSARAAYDLKLLPEQSHDVDLSSDGDVISLRTTGTDPYIVMRLWGQLAADEAVVEFEYFCPAGVDSFSLYHGPPFREAKRIELDQIPIAEGWQTYSCHWKARLSQPLPSETTLLRFDFGTRADVRIQIRNLRFRALTDEELGRQAALERRRQRKLAAAGRISDYLDQEFDSSLKVRVTKQQILLTFSPPANQPSTFASGSATFTVGFPYRIVEFPAHVSLADATERPFCADGGTRVGIGPDNEMMIAVPRYVDGVDRAMNGWRVRSIESGEYVTARRYAAEIDPLTDDPPPSRLIPKSQKGLSGISPRGPLEELPELGIDAATINLVLNRFLASTPGRGREEIECPGEAVYFDSRAFAHYDNLIDFARRNQIVVSAIVLIPRSKQAKSRSPLVHPESDGGVYAMPDLTTPRGVAIYGHILDRIAQRYRDHRRAPGAITNWIAHNEIDFHPTWTNMGPQPRPICTETYYRSMRMISAIARSHNPHARVFVSLTHHWVVPNDGDWQRLAPREVLETLQRYSKLEGDFPWGVAYHPYPQSLFADVAWNDAKTQADLDTPLITIQNLEVLGRFLEQPSMRDDRGMVRPVLLSEQGFHTDSYDQATQAKQAGSLVYAMNKVHRLPWIESFHYHRWIDHPDEGGLKLGLRTLPTEGHPHGERKRSWYVYQAMGTDQQAAATQALPGPRSSR